MLPGGKGGGPGGGPPPCCGVPAFGGMAMFGGIEGGIEPGGGTGGKAPGGGMPAQRRVRFTSYYECFTSTQNQTVELVQYNFTFIIFDCIIMKLY